MEPQTQVKIVTQTVGCFWCWWSFMLKTNYIIHIIIDILLIIRRGGYAALLFGWVNSERPLFFVSTKAFQNQSVWVLTIGLVSWNSFYLFGVSPTLDASWGVHCRSSQKNMGLRYAAIKKWSDLRFSLEFLDVSFTFPWHGLNDLLVKPYPALTESSFNGQARLRSPFVPDVRIPEVSTRGRGAKKKRKIARGEVCCVSWKK